MTSQRFHRRLEAPTSPQTSLPLPGLGFPPGALEQVTLKDLVAAVAWADHRLSQSVLHTNTSRDTVSASAQTPNLQRERGDVPSAAPAGAGSPAPSFERSTRPTAATAEEDTETSETAVMRPPSPTGGRAGAARVRTCTAMVFMLGSRSLSRSKPWWKKVN